MASSYANFITAFYSKTNVSAVVDTADATKLYGIYDGKAISGIPVGRMWGIYNLQGAEKLQYAFNSTRILEVLYIQLRVYAENAKNAENLLATWISTLGNTLTVTGFTVEWIAEDNRLPPIDQLISDRYVFGRGTLIKVGMS